MKTLMREHANACLSASVFLSTVCYLLPQIFHGMLAKHSAPHLNRPKKNTTPQKGVQKRQTNKTKRSESLCENQRPPTERWLL